MISEYCSYLELTLLREIQILSSVIFYMTKKKKMYKSSKKDFLLKLYHDTKVNPVFSFGKQRMPTTV